MRKALLAGTLAVLVLMTASAAADDDEPTTAAAVTSVPVHGHGFGHGRGMGQYGAFGYATDHGWTWQQITDHFYGGTAPSTEPNQDLDVLLKSYKNNDTCATEPMGCWTIVFVERGTLLVQGATGLTGPPPGAPHAVAIQWLGGDDWRVYEGTSCGGFAPGGFVERGTFSADQVHVFLADPNPDERVELISVCEVGRHRYLRGSVVVDSFAHANDTTVRQRTMNRVPVESYLRSVVPAESPSSWGGTNGSAPGQNALNAQAVAARSYALAGDGRYQPADTCDDIFCQVYRGFGTNTAGAVEDFESTNGNLAVSGTAGQIRRTGAGGIARTEFSSSTGGYTAGGTFPAVPDDGDDVSANPNHNWPEVTIPVGEVESRLDAFAGRDMGTFEQFVVTERNGLGEDGGRVELVRAELSGGNVVLTGNQFRSMFQSFGVKSDWFVVAPPTSTSTFNDTAGNVHEENIQKIADAGIAAGYPDGGFHPDESVSRGQMATFLTRGYDLPAASEPTFCDIAGTTHEANIRAVAAAGIALGNNGCFFPSNPVNRGQMAVFLSRAEDLDPVGGTGGCDIEGHTFEGEIRAVMAAGIAVGDANGCFHPDDPVTRGQMATFLVRALGL